ncbi:MAG: hypothetical protein AB1427_03155 [Thermodesulfobacteriota bacterium]
METRSTELAAVKTWILVLLLALFVLVKGFFAFSVVGDLGQPAWDYRPVNDVPGESAYAVYGVMPFPQHVRGAGGE